MGDVSCACTHRKRWYSRESVGLSPRDTRGGLLFRWLDLRKLKGAQRRIGDIYWEGWSSFVLGFFLSAIGLTFVALGAFFLLFAVDRSRGFALLIMGCLLSLPGFYSLMVLCLYVCGREDYSYLQLLSN